jgi:hypothetical protein
MERVQVDDGNATWSILVRCCGTRNRPLIDAVYRLAQESSCHRFRHVAYCRGSASTH